MAWPWQFNGKWQVDRFRFGYTEKFTFFFVFVGCDGGAASAHIKLLGGERTAWLAVIEGLIAAGRGR